MKYGKAKKWQREPNSITTQNVQLWSWTGTMTGTIPLSRAREMIETEKCFVISEQAIGYYDMGLDSVI